MNGKPTAMSIMNTTTHQNTSHWRRRAKFSILVMALAALAVVAFGFYTGQPVFFLKWFFGLQADD